MELGTALCPSTHPFAYYDGEYCCESRYEKNNYKKQGKVCDGGLISLTSRCCRKDQHTTCPEGAGCRSYFSAGN